MTQSTVNQRIAGIVQQHRYDIEQLPPAEAFAKATAAIANLLVEARIDERNQAQQFLHGLTIMPENRHIFDVLSGNNHDRIKALQASKGAKDE